MVTFASGTGTPPGSVTVPLIPLRAWARRPAGEDSSRKPRASSTRKRTVLNPPPKLRKENEKNFMEPPKCLELRRTRKPGQPSTVAAESCGEPEMCQCLEVSFLPSQLND